MSNIEFRSQRKTFFLLLISAILLAFLIDFLASLTFEQVRLYSWEQLLLLVVSVISITVVITPLILTEPRLSIIKDFNIPVVFKIIDDNIKVIDVDGYYVSLSNKLAVEDIFENNLVLKKRFLKSIKSTKSRYSKGDTASDEWNFFFIRNLAQYLIWETYEVTISTDYFNRLQRYGEPETPTSDVPFQDYDKNLRDNLFISAFTRSERKPEGDTSDTASASTEYGRWINPDFVTLKIPFGTKLVVGSPEEINPHLLFKGKFGELKIEYSIYSLGLDGEKISLFTKEELDFSPEGNENYTSWMINIEVSMKLSRFASFRKGLVDFLNWSDAVISQFEMLDWALFLKRIPHQKIRLLEEKLDIVLDEIKRLKKK